MGTPHNEEAARYLANAVACMANTLGGGAIVVGVEDRSSVTADPGFAQPSVRRLPPGAVREAVLNGVVHRDWMQHDPVEVTWIDEDSALQVVSPGGFTRGVTAENVLTHRGKS